jgi:hypothetical protein
LQRWPVLLLGLEWQRSVKKCGFEPRPVDAGSLHIQWMYSKLRDTPITSSGLLHGISQ